ncbi:DUF427 domain-containing protein [Sphingorhabdus sp.]|uniref:DUF427 domain-containing protein n=1 Tax=Sphingorhabdus sp. TaxID=1902408 RepID=UPI0037C5CE38
MTGAKPLQVHNAMRALDTRHSPTSYFPQVDVPLSALRPTAGASFCAWKGHARYLDVIVVG